MSQHLTQDFELSHEDRVIKGKADGQDEGLPNFERPSVVQKQWLFGEVEVGVLNSSYKMHVSGISLHKIPLGATSVLATGGDVRNLYDTLMSSGEDS
ncbi:unnamed protein product [Vicia faba]|uniref:Uncharacterized protein n=1 Tax=Vicia faba TaxID=3906 RepID=A0AAV0ZI60_VICFA|nr:unnamed protein product [Vicia faba]